MKRILLILFSVFSSSMLSAQKIHFTDTSNIWKELVPEYNSAHPTILNYYTYSFIGDSTIASIAYRNFSFGLVREDTILNKVYLRDPIGDTDIVLMDYNLNVGDTFVTLYNRFRVLKIDSTLINSVWHKVWYFPFYTGGWYTGTDTIYVIEGIGCLEDPTFMVTDYSSCVECMQPFMYCFSHHGITPAIAPSKAWLDNSTSCTTFPTLYVNQLQPLQDKLTISPNPASTFLNISASDRITTIAINNLLGQTLYSHEYNSQKVQVDVSNLPAGVYLIRINDTVVRKFVKE